MRHYLVSAFILALASGGVLSTAHAKDTYGTAGCGLGSLLFGNEPGLVQVLAATTNGTGVQTFGITSGTSNCGETAASTASTKAFIQANRETVAKEIARGSGETISSITALAGCQDAAAVGSTLQQSFSQIFPNEQVSDIAVGDSVIQTLEAHPELACRALS
jgi:Protein of unknown function (DUF3015)